MQVLHVQADEQLYHWVEDLLGAMRHGLQSGRPGGVKVHVDPSSADSSSCHYRGGVTQEPIIWGWGEGDVGLLQLKNVVYSVSV